MAANSCIVTLRFSLECSPIWSIDSPDSLKPQCEAHMFFPSSKNGTWDHLLPLDDGVGNHLPADMHSELISALWIAYASSD